MLHFRVVVITWNSLHLLDCGLVMAKRIMLYSMEGKDYYYYFTFVWFFFVVFVWSFCVLVVCMYVCVHSLGV